MVRKGVKNALSSYFLNAFLLGCRNEKNVSNLGVFLPKFQKRLEMRGEGVKILRVIVEVDVILSSAILHFSKLMQLDNRVALCNTFRISIKDW